MNKVEIHVAANGFAVASPEDGLIIANDLNELQGIIQNIFASDEAKPAAPAPVAPAAPAPVAPAAPAPVAPAAPAPVAPGGFGPKYDAESKRMLSENDRKAAHARLEALVSAGAIVEYNKRNGIEKLVEAIIEGDKLAQGGGVPAPVAPAAGAVTIGAVTAGLQALAQSDPKEGPAKAYAIMNKYGATKVSELVTDYWPSIIAEANQARGES